MGMPRKLKNFTLFVDGTNYAGEIGELNLIKLARKVEEWRGGGMNVPIEADLGMEKMEFEWTCGGFMRQPLEQWGITQVGGALLRFAGAYQRDDDGEVDAVELVVRGRHKEIDPGKAKAGDDTEFKITSSVSYYKLSINGTVLIEIDVLNMVEMVGGVDRLAEQRRALGM
ncbi:phage major tail tube protein [Jeongeupia chitinilytica]|uniref:Major tail tube protein n=1 Tax=Jeongeupia chitinilytica TaxID=1041641 RepID=A0ABQ3H136_9NEIS|nr:phage major tail tube protein [Jeongeupia chitinilytica]GHD59835.1 major tail tube protein [Jeongeupia chitinilytica]